MPQVPTSPVIDEGERIKMLWSRMMAASRDLQKTRWTQANIYEQRYADAYQNLVKAGVQRQLKGKYR